MPERITLVVVSHGKTKRAKVTRTEAKLTNSIWHNGDRRFNMYRSCFNVPAVGSGGEENCVRPPRYVLVLD